MKMLNSVLVRYLSALIFFAAVFAAGSQGQPLQAQQCFNEHYVVYVGPNEGSWDNQQDCDNYWTELARGQADDDCKLCGNNCFYNDGFVVQNCCPADGAYSWDNGITACTCTDE